MEDNPYERLAGALRSGRRTGSGGLLLGAVLTAPGGESPDTPLTVAVSGTVQEPEDLLKNAGLDTLGFAPGDQLLLLPVEDAQRYIIICKVVSA